MTAMTLVLAACSGPGAPAELELPLATLMSLDPEIPPGWWTLEAPDDGQLWLTTPTGARFPIGEAVEDEGGRLELTPLPDCGSDTEGGTYSWEQTDGGFTFTAREEDGCPDREQTLTKAPWEPTTVPPLIEEVPEPTPAPVVATVPLPIPPAHLAVLDGSIWVTASRDASVYRIDPEANAVAATLSTGSFDEYRWMTVGEGSVWVSLFDGDHVSRLDPRTGAATNIRVGRNPTGALAAFGAVWVSNHREGTVSRIDPATNAVTDTIDVSEPGPGGPQELAAVDDAIEVVVPRTSEIRRIDPNTLDVSIVYSGRTVGSLEVNDAGSWIIEGLDATWVTRVGPDGEADLLVSVGEARRPRDVAATEDAVWVLTVGDESPSSRIELLRADARTGQVTDRYDLFGYHEGQLWMAVGTDGDVWVTTDVGLARVDGSPAG